MTVPGQGLSLITPHALLVIFLWRSRFVGALPRDTRLELSFSQISLMLEELRFRDAGP